ncbi:MAG: SPOR domain-containing protein [Treponema sp.]|jgi:cell division septation protein DedD|nr:SPOR domain-containing protein [Treponema sp.]
MKTNNIRYVRHTKKVSLALYASFAAAFLLFAAASDSACAQEASSANLILEPSQERIPQSDRQPQIPPEYIIPPIGIPPSAPAERTDAPPPVSANLPSFKAPLVSSLERGKWYVQIGVYTRADHAEDAVNRVGTASPVVIHNAGTDINPMFRVLLGPFSQNESKTMLQRFRNKGYEAFLRKG